MTATALLTELKQAGVNLTRNGNRLHVEAKPGTLTDELRDQLAAHKLELLTLLDSPAAIREKLLALACVEHVPVTIVQRLPVADLDACAGCTDNELGAYLRALAKSERMGAGIVPTGYTLAATCAGCGPVWLWPGAPARVLACPWCFRRKAGTAIPRPAEVTP